MPLPYNLVQEFLEQEGHVEEDFKLGTIIDKVSFLQVSKQKLHLIHGLTDYQVSNCVATFYYMLYSHLIVVG